MDASQLQPLIASEAEYRSAIDELLGLAQREVCIFDRDLGRLALDAKYRSALVETFIAADSLRRLRIVLHDSAVVEGASPRLRELIRRFPGRIELRQTPDELRHLADSLFLVDGQHGLIRFHVDHARSKRVLADPAPVNPTELAGRLQRFEDLWEASAPLSLGTVLGL